MIQNVAIVQDGIIYGKMKTVEKNFLNFMSVLVIRNATTPPNTMAMMLARSDMITAFFSGIQK